MSLRNKIKKHLPSYRSEKRIMEEMAKLKKEMREMDKKNEFLFWNAQMQSGESMQEAKERMFAAMPKATGRLRNIQLAENDIMRRVKKICDENGLQFFLMGGTLLGAVRHKGFIPWDNDIDIGIMKADFLKLKEIMANNEVLVLDNYYKYADGLKVTKIKYRDNEVFFIDVFVFDYIDATPETADKMWAESQKANIEYTRRLRELCAPYAGKKICRPEANAELDKMVSEFEAEFMRDYGYMGHGDYFCEPIDCPYWSRDPRGIMPVKDHLPLVKDAVEFEGVKYDAWKNFDKALEHMYGDIWRLPFSVSEPHTTEFDEGFGEAVEYIRKIGVIE